MKIINIIKGGIGNQLFQYVFGASLSRRTTSGMFIDIDFYSNDPYGNQPSISSLFPEVEIAKATKFKGKGSYLLNEGQICELNQLKQLPPDIEYLILNGYWQGETYFDKEIAFETYNQLTIKSLPLVNVNLINHLKNSKNAIAIHMRRRDYGHMGLCKASYYVAGIRYLHTIYPDAEFYVFTDEPNYARHLMRSANCPFNQVASGSDIGDLYLMSLCRHFVISNSSYSWWGAWFGEQCQGSRGSIVITPKEWTTIDTTPSPSPNRWVVLPDAVEPFTINLQEVALSAERIHQIRFDDATRNWFSVQGDKNLRVDFPELNPESIVLDLGGYRGDWTAEIVRRYDAHVMIFEPLTGFYNHLSNRFNSNSKVRCFQFGLGTHNHSEVMHHSNDASSIFAVEGDPEQVRILEVTQFLKQHNIEQIDVLKINIEGGEYDLIDHMILNGAINKVRKLQVQFHDFVPNAITRRAAIQSGLAKTHIQKWNYYFVWEEWDLK